MTRMTIWRTIADAVTEEIAAGQYAPGEKLPTEAQLAGRFGVNRHTVRRALAELSQEGRVWSRRGAGVFVAEPPTTEYPIGRRVRFHQQISASGRLPSKHVLSLETRKATADEAEALKIAKYAPVHVYDGLSFADALPIAVFRSVFPAEILPGLPARLQESGSVTAALKAEGVPDYTRRVTRLHASKADATEARHLRLAEGSPVLRTSALNVDRDGNLVEYGITVFAGERVTLTVGEE